MDFVQFQQFAKSIDENVTDDKMHKHLPRFLGIGLIFFLMLSMPVNPYVTTEMGAINSPLIPKNAFADHNGFHLEPVLVGTERHEKNTIEKWLNSTLVPDADGNLQRVENYYYVMKTEEIPFVQNSTYGTASKSLNQTDGQRWIEYEKFENSTDIFVNSASPFSIDKNTGIFSFYDGLTISGGVVYGNETYTKNVKLYWQKDNKDPQLDLWELGNINTQPVDVYVNQDSTGLYITVEKLDSISGESLKSYYKEKNGELVKEDFIYTRGIDTKYDQRYSIWVETLSNADEVEIADGIFEKDGVEIKEKDNKGTVKIKSAEIKKEKDDFNNLDKTIKHHKNKRIAYIDFTQAEQFYTDTLVSNQNGKIKTVDRYMGNNSTLLEGQQIIIDPTYGYVDGTYGRFVTTTQTGTSCSTTFLSKPSTTERIYQGDSDLDLQCDFGEIWFDTTPIPDEATVTDTVLKIDVDATTGEACDINPMQFDSSEYGTTYTGQDILDDIRNGTGYVDANAWCQTTGNGKTIDLTSTADTDLQNKLSSDFFGIGLTYADDITRDPTNESTTFSDSQLQVTYTLPEPKPEYSTSYIFDETLSQYNLTLASPDSLYDDYDTIGQTILKDGFYPPYSITTEPLAHITFDDTGDTNPVDFGSRDGTTTTTGALDYRASPLGHGAYFDGTNDYVTLSDESDFDFDISSAHSFSFWYDTDEISTEVIIGKTQVYNTQDGYAILIYTDGDIQTYYRSSTPQNTQVITTETCSDWCHGVVTYDGSGNRNGFNIYINGVLSATGTSSTITGSWLNNHALTVGAETGGTSDAFTGNVDDVRIYDYELTSAQVTDIYNFEYSTKYTYPSESDLAGTDNLVASWNFDNTLHDDSLSGEDLQVLSGSELYNDGDYGRALHFNDNESFTNAGSTLIETNITNTTAWSIATKVKINSNTPTNDWNVFIATLSASVKGYSFHEYNGQIYSQLVASSGGNSMSVKSSASTYRDDTYHTIVATNDGTGTASGMSIWVDGVDVTTVNTDALVGDPTQTDDYEIGSWGLNSDIAQMDLDWMKVYSDELTQSEIWALGNMTNYSESNTISITDSNISAPFSANYTGISITSLGHSVDNTSVYSAPAPDDTSALDISSSSTDTTITFDVDTEPECYGTCHGYYGEILNSTDSLYYPINLYGSTYVPLPLAHWKFDGKETGRTNYGTGTIGNLEQVNIASFVDENGGKYKSGVIAGALDVTKAGVKTQLIDESVFDIDYTDELTISAWIKPDSVSGTQYLVQKYNFVDSVSDGWVFYLAGDDLRWFESDGIGATVQCTATTDVLVVDNWYNVVISKSGSATSDCSNIDMYINGTSQAMTWGNSGTWTGDLLNDYNFGIGSPVDYTFDGDFNGLIDDVKIWNTALTSTYVANNYANLAPEIDSNPYGKELAHWKFNSNTYDSAHGYNGKVTSSPTYASQKINNGITFDGTDDVIEILDESVFDWTSGSRTYSFWFSDTTNSTESIISKSEDGGNQNWALRLRSTGNFEFVFQNNTSSWENYQTTTSSTCAKDGTLHHVIFSFTIGDGSSAKFYCDNSEMSGSWQFGGDGSSTPLTNDVSVTIGATTSTAQFYDGVIDDLRIFTKVLSSAERSELYNSGSGTESPLGVTVDATPSVTVSSLTEDTGYTAKFYPIGGAGQSGDAVTEVEGTTTSAPVLDSVTQGTGVSLDLSWTAPTAGTPTSYTIQRSPSGCASFANIATGETGTTYNDSTTQSSTEYCYQVLSVNAYGSIESNEVSQTTGASGGSGGGGGGSSPKTVQTIVQDLFNLSLFENHHFVKLGDVLDNEALAVNWNTEQNIQITSIVIGENGFTSRGGIIGLPKTPFTLLGDSSGSSSDMIKYTISVPATPCTEITTSNCMSIDKHEIPITITVLHDGKETVLTKTITIEIISDFDLALIIVLLAVALPVAGYLLRKKGKGKAHHKSASSILNSHPSRKK